MANERFDVGVALGQIDRAIQAFPKAMLFELADDGFNSPFEQLIACMISIRTRDEVSLNVARRLFDRARTPRQMIELSVDEIDRLIYQSSFHENKAAQILAIAQQSVNRLNGEIPCDQRELMTFKGVGLKCANLVLGIACDEPHVAVDIHVHRITNRWGIVDTKTPEKTSEALEALVSPEYWVGLNRELVPFGKHICTGKLPRCSTCTLLNACEQVGVTNHR